MGKNGFPVSMEQLATIKEMAEAGRTTQQISSKVSLPYNVVNWQMEKHNIKTNHSRMGKHYKKKEPILYQDFSELEDNVLFDWRKFPSI